jgi:hypothetical protein
MPAQVSERFIETIRDGLQNRGFFVLLSGRVKAFGTNGNRKENIREFAEFHGWKVHLGRDAAVFTNASRDGESIRLA